MSTLECHKTHVIACDLDDTLVATKSHSEQERQESDEALRQIGDFIINLREQNERMPDENGKVYFGSSTGRAFTSIQELAAERTAFNEIFRMMDFHSTAVGSAIFAPAEDGSGFTRILSWPNVHSWDRMALADRLATHPDLALQKAAAQDTHKISYETTSQVETTAYADQLQAYLGAAGLQAEVIVSGGGSWRFVDFLPPGVNKGSALLQLPGLLEPNGTVQEDVVCRIAAGDSMNDEPALAVADVSIIPRNGQDDLLRWAEDGRRAGSLYIVKKPFAGGVLQGLRKHLPKDS